MEFIMISLNVLIVVLLLALLFKKGKKSNELSVADLEPLKRDIKEGFSDARKEARDMSAENRKENRENFRELQTTVLERVDDNLKLQKEQLSNFSEQLGSFKEALSKSAKDANAAIAQTQKDFTTTTGEKLDTFDASLKVQGKENREELNKGLLRFQENLDTTLNSFKNSLRENFEAQNMLQKEAQQASLEGVKEVRATVEKQLKDIREDNTKQLNEMRITVDEKLQSTLEKRLGESFKQVSERLELVHKGLGEMQTIATGVGDLKRVLSNVKTRGVLGEYQLGNILEQILTPEQYSTNVATKKGSQANVEYAIKLPGKNDEKEVWIPIDSKFPIESYQILLDAYDQGDKDAIDSAHKTLLKTIELFAKDINSKYIDPPHTTDFAILFLPVESLYAEVLRHPGLFELLQNKYKITVTGPTTLSALLNSLQMGFHTLAVQKRSSEVWDILSAVKTEFNQFEKQLKVVQKQLNTASGSLETLQGTRTNQMKRKLNNVQTIEIDTAKQILELPNEPDSNL